MKKRILSFFMAICIVFGCFIFSPAVSAAEEMSYTFLDHTNMYGAHIHSDAKLSKLINPDGSFKSFKLDIDMYSDFAIKRENTDFTSTVDDFYVADKAGRYLVELWGGDGADTTAAIGGVGGYVYGVISLEEGDILVYSLGGGGLTTNVVGRGGGANGGGGYGNQGSTTVGGGGGYSALYLFDASEADAFNTNYVDRDGHLKRQIIESDRISKYVMIAGGGGGAGSYGTDNRSTAYGGAGGSMTHTSGHLSAEDGYDVSGTFYSGVGGGSTDGSGEYAGKGGSYLPGEPLKTVLSWGTTVQPNDWKGTYNKNLIGGAGGAGNYRGGGGGGGFCGGSGGLMSNIVLAHGVGGGGGGSSFVGDVFTAPPSLEADGMRQGQTEKEGRGGQVHIVYLDENDDGHLEDLDIEFARTPYFAITSFEVANTVTENGVTTTKDYEFIESEADREGREKIDINYAIYDIDTHSLVDAADENTTTTLKFKIPKVSLMPAKDGEARDHLSITLEFIPKEDFAGGNNIPLFVDDVIRCVPFGEEEEKTGEITFATHCGYVNVPLNFNPAPVNHTPQGLDPETVSHKVSSLYLDHYASVRSNPSADWRYHFIEEIGEHEVYSEREPDVKLDPLGSVSPDETTRYYVKLRVKPKDVPTDRTFYAKVDEPVTEKIFTGVSVISILGTGMDTLNDNMVVYAKTINYSEATDEYVLSLNVYSDSSGSIIGHSLPKFSGIEYNAGGSTSGSSVGRESTVNIPIDGVYTITLKGGNGGNGGSANFLGTRGGRGGDGGTVSATFELKHGTSLKFYAGANAEDASGASAGAPGGECSYVAVLGENATISYYLMIAAGGGGGGGAAILGSGKTGTSPNSKALSVSADKKTSLEGFNGGEGGDGSILFTGGSAGSASSNYVYKAPASEDAAVVHVSSENITNTSEALGGNATLTCDSIGKSGSGSSTNLVQYTIETAISKYFDVKRITVTQAETESELVDALGSYTTSYMLDSSNGAGEADREYTKVVATINPTKNLLEGEGASAIYGVDYTLNIYLTPRADFLGGNDVELIAAQKALTGMLTGMKLSQNGLDDYINVDEDRALDYVNVAISESLKGEIALEVKDDVYILDGAPVIKSSLVKSIRLPNLGGFTWEDDYIKLIDPTTDHEELTPAKTQDYTIVAGYGPLYEEPYTNVRSASDIKAVTVEKTATVHTEARIEYVLTGVTPDGLEADSEGKYTDLVEFSEHKYAKEDYTIGLSLVSMGSSHHHHMPNAITVTVDDETLEAGVGYTYTRIDDESATLTIYQEYITANVVITVEACHESFTLTYAYQEAPESDNILSTSIDRHFDEPVNLEVAFEGKELPKEYEHYKLNWYHGGELTDLSTITKMPKRNLLFTGRYDPVDYTITVNYHRPDGTVTTVEHILPYNSEYNLPSETIENHIPSVAVISGIVTGDKVYDVTYTSAEGKLTIYYLYADNSEAAPAYNSDPIDVGNGYDVVSPTVEGYTPDKESISGTMTAEGVIETVIYSPNKYKVTFNADGGSCSVASRTVEYDNTYGYNADSLTYEALPVPVKLGATFEGWLLDGVLVDANSKVKITENSELVAKWKEIKFTLTINYVTDLGVTVSSTSASLSVGDTYEYETPVHPGHTADKLSISGTMAAQNTVITITYNRNTYTVTVKFETSEGDELAPSVVQEIIHGSSYSIAVPEVTGYKPNMSVVEGVVNASDVNVTVYYYSEAISVDIAWGGMDFSCDVDLLWDPQTHTYSYTSVGFTPVDNSNTVTVTNNTETQDITVEFDFVVASQYSQISGRYTADNNESGADLGDVKIGKKGKTATAYFWLNDIDDEEKLGSMTLPDNFVAGNCVVIIKN